MKFGPYHRAETPDHQTSDDALKQVATGEIWGSPGRLNFEPCVRAYKGELPSIRGIEFTTDTAVHAGSSTPIEVYWYLSTPGVLKRIRDGDEFACILAEVKNGQP